MTSFFAFDFAGRFASVNHLGGRPRLLGRVICIRSSVTMASLRLESSSRSKPSILGRSMKALSTRMGRDKSLLRRKPITPPIWHPVLSTSGLDVACCVECLCSTRTVLLIALHKSDIRPLARLLSLFSWLTSFTNTKGNAVQYCSLGPLFYRNNRTANGTLGECVFPENHKALIWAVRAFSDIRHFVRLRFCHGCSSVHLGYPRLLLTVARNKIDPRDSRPPRGSALRAAKARLALGLRLSSNSVRFGVNPLVLFKCQSCNFAIDPGFISSGSQSDVFRGNRRVTARPERLDGCGVVTFQSLVFDKQPVAFGTSHLRIRVSQSEPGRKPETTVMAYRFATSLGPVTEQSHSGKTTFLKYLRAAVATEHTISGNGRAACGARSDYIGVRVSQRNHDAIRRILFCQRPDK
jgi:hypothetical protein